MPLHSKVKPIRNLSNSSIHPPNDLLQEIMRSGGFERNSHMYEPIA